MAQQCSFLLLLIRIWKTIAELLVEQTTKDEGGDVVDWNNMLAPIYSYQELLQARCRYTYKTKGINKMLN